VGRADGRVVFVPLGAPGDVVRVELVQERKSFARGRILSIETAGARRAPPCRFFERCGGCSWLHVPEAVQSAARREILIDALQRIGRWNDLPEVELLPSPLALGYRARARVAYARGQVGFRERGSHRVVPIDRCAVLDEPTQKQLEAVAAKVPAGSGEIAIRGFESSVDGLRVGDAAFFQANRSLWQFWVELVAECCGTGDLLLELFAGVGFYTRRLQSNFERIIAVEQARSARDLRVNTSAEVFESSVERFLTNYAFVPAPDVVLLNPPRVGCARGVLARVASHTPRRLVYVSCEPATLARDLLELSGSYRMRRLIAIDALPQTHHVEAIAVLESD